MCHERPIITRRNLLKGSAAALLLEAAFVRGLQLQSHYIDAAYKKDKEVQPHLKENIENSSMFLGVYPHRNNIKNVRHLNDFGIVGYFGPWYDWTAKNAIFAAAPGQIPLISVGPSYKNEPRRRFRYRDLVEQKDHIRKQAQNLACFSTCLFRYGYEMNGDWFPYGSTTQSPREFIDGWNFVVEIVKKANPNVLTVWAPNVDYPIEPYFPGDSDIKPDIMALDGYCKRHASLLHARHLLPDPSPAQLFAKDVLALQELDDDIPIFISEIGVDYGNTPRARTASFNWMTEALSRLATYDRVMGICLFSWNKGRGILDMHEGNWGNILTDEFHEMIQQNPFYSPRAPEQIA
ncbi:MAG: glycoside hydrolase family 26 protein [Candidatus Roizmanbacteria bacterium]|nr:glycoside hydrolase family 26 protein [Candidatus Roizmanbacteria bacterium]